MSNPASGGSNTANAPTKPEPVAVAFTVGNTYRRLSPSEASYDKRTGRHLKIHDWTLFVDVLPGQDPDIIDRVTFDMRDDSFVTKAFTCHSPIRIQNATAANASAGGGTSSAGASIVGQPTKEGKDELSSASKRPHPNKSRWRFSTRQQTFGAVDVQINIRGRGGCRCTVPYTIVLSPGGHECSAESLPLFIEKRPHQQLKPLKISDTKFMVEMHFGLDGISATSSSLYDVAKSVYSRSKLLIQLLLEDGQMEVFGNKQSAATTAWLVKAVQPSSAAIIISSPEITGGEGLNQVYKIIEGLPPTCVECSPSGPFSLAVQIDVSKLSLQQVIKVSQNYVKYEEAMDSFASWHQREDRCQSCRSNKQAVEGDTNKQRNVRISKCETWEELVSCLNPVEAHHYKLNLRRLIGHSNNRESSPNRSIEFRQHSSSKDKTTVTHWIRFCTAFIRNSARLRAPMALKATTSIEEEFDLLFEYVVKDRALRNFYKEKRYTMIAEEEKERSNRLDEVAKKSSSVDSMSISESSSEVCSLHIHSKNKRNAAFCQQDPRKRACL